MIVFMLLFSSFTLFCADTYKTIKGNLCIPYNKLYTASELGPYREPCFNAFNITKIEKKDEHELDHLWLSVRAFSENSKNWHLNGHQDINDNSTNLNKSFPAYIPLKHLLNHKDDQPLILKLFINGQRFITCFSLHQDSYQTEPFCNTLKTLELIIERFKRQTEFTTPQKRSPIIATIKLEKLMILRRKCHLKQIKKSVKV